MSGTKDVGHYQSTKLGSDIVIAYEFHLGGHISRDGPGAHFLIGPIAHHDPTWHGQCCDDAIFMAERPLMVSFHGRPCDFFGYRGVFLAFGSSNPRLKIVHSRYGGHFHCLGASIYGRNGQSLA